MKKYFTLNLKAVCSETLAVIYQTTLSQISENRNLDIHCNETSNIILYRRMYKCMPLPDYFFLPDVKNVPPTDTRKYTGYTPTPTPHPPTPPPFVPGINIC
jgi:hypothetical protein